MKDNKHALGVILFTILFLFIFEGFFFYWVGYITGIFATWLVGERIVEGLACLGIIITPHQIPMIMGALSVFGGCFGKTSYNRPQN